MENKIETLFNFLSWKKTLHSEIRGGEVMYDIPHYYKWVRESELLDFYFKPNKNEQ